MTDPLPFPHGAASGVTPPFRHYLITLVNRRPPTTLGDFIEDAHATIDARVGGQAFRVLGATRCAGDRIVLYEQSLPGTAGRTWQVDQYDAYFFISPRS